MTSLRTFQNEIEEIHTRELTRQRVIGHAVVNEQEKENKKPHGDPSSTPVAKQSVVANEGAEEDEGCERVLVCQQYVFGIPVCWN